MRNQCRSQITILQQNQGFKSKSSMNIYKKKESKKEMKTYKYIPAKGDKIDKALSGFINTYPYRERLIAKFVRLEQGLYHYGNLQLIVKIDFNGQIFVNHKNFVN